MKPDSTRTVYEGKLLELKVEQWGDREREIVEHRGSVAIVAIDRAGYVTLVRQYREAARAHLLELPAGGLEPGEEPLAAARRELAEEVGLRGGEWRLAARFWPSPGFLRELLHVYIAEQLERGEAQPEATEELELVRWPVGEIEHHLGELEDAKTIVGLLLYLRGR